MARALTRNGSSIIWPSTTKAPTPFAAASSAAARMRPGLLDLGRTRHEALVGDRNLRGMDAALARKPEIAGLLAFLAVPLRLRHHGVGAVIGRNLRLRRRKADRHADIAQGLGSDRLMPHGSKRSA